MGKSRRDLLRQSVAFMAVVAALSAAVFFWMFRGGGRGMAPVAVMMWVPALAAGVASLLFGEGLGALGWRPGRARWLAWGYLAPVAVSLAAYGLVWLSGLAPFSAEAARNYRWAAMLGFSLPAPFAVGLLSKALLASLVALPFVLGEEIGWSGYLTPRLVRAFPLPLASLIVGVFWAAWHFPAVIGGLYGTGTPLWAALPGFTLVLVGASFLRSVLVQASGSLWPGVALHVGHNVFLMGIFREMTARRPIADYLVSEDGIFLGLVYIAAAALFWRARKGRRARA